MNENLGQCTNGCGAGEYIFNNIDTFCDWLFGPENAGTKKCKTICIAHWMSGFDGQFLLQYLEQNGIKPDIIPKNTMLMCINVDEIHMKIIDSYNFMSMALAALPKTFGIPQLAKGYFPHLFNTAENENYTGQYPDASYYDPGNMKPDEKIKFESWYTQVVRTKTFQLILILL